MDSWREKLIKVDKSFEEKDYKGRMKNVLVSRGSLLYKFEV